MHIDIDTTDKKEQRKFGLLMAAAIIVLGLIRWAFHGFNVFPINFFIVASVFLILGLLLPKALKPVFDIWLRFAVVLNWFMTRLFLTVAFYLLIVPIGIIFRLFGEDPMKRKWKPESDSYWEEPEEQPSDFNRYRKMF